MNTPPATPPPIAAVFELDEGEVLGVGFVGPGFEPGVVGCLGVGGPSVGNIGENWLTHLSSLML